VYCCSRIPTLVSYCNITWHDLNFTTMKTSNLAKKNRYSFPLDSYFSFSFLLNTNNFKLFFTVFSGQKEFSCKCRFLFNLGSILDEFCHIIILSMNTVL
jgi:hypothetical protein